MSAFFIIKLFVFDFLLLSDSDLALGARPLSYSDNVVAIVDPLIQAY
jgi:hypothetical protein